MAMIDALRKKHAIVPVSRTDVRPYQLDLRELRVGIPFDRWSEDPHNTPAGLPTFESVAEWVPWHAQRPIPGMEEAWYAIVDDYLADPADEAKFWRFYDAIDEMTEPDAWNGGADAPGVAWMRAIRMGLSLMKKELDAPNPTIFDKKRRSRSSRS